MKYINILFAALVLCASTKAFSQTASVKVSSPDKRLVLTVSTINKKLVYNIKADKKSIIDTSPLGLIADSIDLGNNVSFWGVVKGNKIDERYPIMGNHPVAHNLASRKYRLSRPASK